MSGPRFLIEIGTEEIPDRMLARSGEDLQRLLAGAIEPIGLLVPGSEWSVWTTPRRLAVSIGPLRARQEDRDEEAIGPPVRVAFDAQGRPTKAAEGFASGLGVSPEALQRVRTARGEYVALTRRVEGRPASSLLAELLPEVVGRLRFPKMMRWGEVGYRFVRPIRWIVALLDDEVVPVEIAGVRSGRVSHGLRTGDARRVELAQAAGYQEALRSASVIVDPDERREIIQAGLAAAAAAAGGVVGVDDGLLEILVHMTEDPSVIHGTFREEFLELPREVLVTAMRHHQRYFSVLHPGRRDLLPAFLAVLNRSTDPEGVIRRGNEWVLQARLADARFFWAEDGKQTLEARLPGLERVIFQEELGSYRDKVARVEELIRWIGPRASLPAETIDRSARAGRLSKCDLTTEMVGEFPELQGIIGGVYAARDGEPPEVADAIYDHYRPAGGGDDLPRAAEGLLLALADRLDTLTGYFLLGKEPTGTRDPYALRRAALGVARILAATPWFLPLGALLQRAIGLYPASVRRSDDAAQKLQGFLLDRVRHLSQEAGHRYDSVGAVLAVQADDLRDAALRMEALTTLRGDPRHEEAFLSLSAAFKRIRNLLVKDDGDGDLRPESLVEAPERELHQALERSEGGLETALEGRDYLRALRSIAGLRAAVDAFLGSSKSEGVLVMAPEPELRRNRLALLRRAGKLFTSVADFSEIVVEGETAGDHPIGSKATRPGARPGERTGA